MKILVVNRIPLGDEGKIMRKHHEQVNAFENIGCDTYSIGFIDEKCYIVHNGEKLYVCDAPLRGYRSYLAMYKAGRRACKLYGFFDVVYMRMIPAHFALLKFLKDIRPFCNKLVYEFPTFPYDKERNKKVSFLRRCSRILDDFCRGYLKKFVDKAVILTDDSETAFGIKTIVLKNGIIVEDYPLKKPSKEEKIHIMCVAKLRKWHGYDRLIKGAIDYVQKHNGEAPFVLHIVGEGVVLPMLKEMVREANISEDIIKFHGWLIGQELDALFDKCSFAVESLGLHRLDLKYSSTLKSREYLARGIPFIYSLDIPGIDESCDYCLKVPSDESAIDMEKVLLWYKDLADDSGVRMREYALQKFTWEAQFKKMFAELEKED